jgi:hypothetical protein
LRADLWCHGLVTADVADHARRSAVEGERYGAVLTLVHISAALAHKRCREAATIEKENALLFSLQPLLHRGDQSLAEDRSLPLCLTAHIDDPDERQLLIIDRVVIRSSSYFPESAL